MAFKIVDFPLPFIPMMIRNDPSEVALAQLHAHVQAEVVIDGVVARPVVEVDGHVRQGAHLVAGARVKGLRDVLDAEHLSVYRRPRTCRPSEASQQRGRHQRDEHEDRRDQLEVVGIEAPTQRDRYQKPEEDRAHNGAA